VPDRTIPWRPCLAMIKSGEIASRSLFPPLKDPVGEFAHGRAGSVA
jgi:hypothetical protein